MTEHTDTADNMNDGPSLGCRATQAHFEMYFMDAAAAGAALVALERTV